MSESDSAKKILKEILDIFSLIFEKMDDTFKFYSIKTEQKDLKKKFPNIDFYKEKIISFETNTFYIYLIKKTFDYLGADNRIYFESSYSILYFKRIIRYLTELSKSDIDIEEDDSIKLFFYLLYIFFDEKLKNISIKDDSNLYLDLDETFFKGTFIELTEKYSSKLIYQDSQDLINYINHYKRNMKKQIISRLDSTFQYIKEILICNSNKNDELIKAMYNDAGGVLYEIDVLSNDDINLSKDLINKLNNFYSNENYLIFTNYISETNRDDLKYNIDKEFLQNIKNDYFPFKFDFSFEGNLTNFEYNQKIDNYINHRNTYYKRMLYSWFPEVWKYGLDSELGIFAFSRYKISEEFNKIQKFKMKLENLEQKDIIKLIKDILNDNDFFEKYFSILKSNIVKDFFNSYLTINEKDNTFQKDENKTSDSECFSEVYSYFINQYDKANDDYQEFKDLITYKILPFGDRAYTFKKFKKIVINPVQFFLGNKLKVDLEMENILKGYLIVILLHETEHFLRTLGKKKNISLFTPRQREGGKLFIKYLFDVYSINHINKEQADKILDLKTWNDHKGLKKIFISQLEEIEEERGENFNEFLTNYFTSSISFFSRRTKKFDNNAKKFNLDEYLKK